MALAAACAGLHAVLPRQAAEGPAPPAGVFLQHHELGQSRVCVQADLARKRAAPLDGNSRQRSPGHRALRGLVREAERFAIRFL